MSAPTWWLVITRPSAETNEPEPPLLNRTADERRRVIHSGVGSKPWRSLSDFSGRLLKTHIPSSACTVPPRPRTARTAIHGRIRMRRPPQVVDVGPTSRASVNSDFLFPRLDAGVDTG